MAITIRYGSYTHASGEVEISNSRQSLLTQAETVYAEMVTINLRGTLIGDGVTAIDGQLLALADAYSRDGEDFVVFDDISGTNLANSLFSSQTLGGIRVMQRPSLPDGRNASQVTFLNYQISLQALVQNANSDTDLRSYSEVLQFSGGGTRTAYLETRVGLPEEQTLTQNQIYRAVQSGQSVGLYERPTAPDPIWPSNIVTAEPDITKTSARRVGAGARETLMDFGIRWRYQFESAQPLVGVPGTWGIL
jgi:hypothetical protein